MASTGVNIVFGVFCFLSLGCGITYSVLVGQVINFIYEKLDARGVHEANHVGKALWMIGLAYIIPGLMGLMACCTRRRGLYIAHMILALLAVGILAGLFFLGMASAGMKTEGPHFCEIGYDGICFCESDTLRLLLKYFSCREINQMVRMGISTDAMFFGGGIITLIAAILSGAIMKSLKGTPETTTPGTGMDYIPTAAKQQFTVNPYKRFDQ